MTTILFYGFFYVIFFGFGYLIGKVLKLSVFLWLPAVLLFLAYFIENMDFFYYLNPSSWVIHGTLFAFYNKSKLYYANINFLEQGVVILHDRGSNLLRRSVSFFLKSLKLTLWDIPVLAFKKVFRAEKYRKEQEQAEKEETDRHRREQEADEQRARKEEQQSHYQTPTKEEIRQLTPYEVLGVNPDANIQEIKKAYFKIIRGYHPDRVDLASDEIKKLATKRSQEINEAYALLKKRHGR